MIHLLDTHALIWFVEGSDALSLSARDAIEDPENFPLYSIASIWEIAIKLKPGKPRRKRNTSPS
jgi:PIN domain nuclease of toxin-antitoxin system